MAANKNGGWFKWIIILAVVAGGVWAGVWYFTGRADAAPEYITTTVTRGEVIQAVTANGTLNPVVNIQVGSQVSGIILKLYADFNSIVKSNQVVAELDPATYQSNLRSAQGDLASAKASLELNEVQAKRAEELFNKKLISGSDYDQAVADLHQSQSQVQIKEASVANAQVALGRCTIYAPVDGVVISRNVDVGQTVAASMSAPVLFQIANDLTKMQIDANVSEADIGAIEEGQAVTFTVDAFPSRLFTGMVRQIRNSPTTVQNVVTYDCVIEVSNPDLKLRPGMTANASLIIAHHENVLKIPNAAFRFKPADPSTNKTFFARLFGGDEVKKASTNAVPAAVAKPADASNDTNEIGGAGAALTGNEPPDELQKRVAAMRARGDDIPEEITAKLREYYQSGVLQRGPGGGAGGGRGGGGRRNAAAMTGGGRGMQPSSRTVYVASNNPNDPAPKAVRVRTGISDGTFTEITEGLQEGDTVIVSLKMQTAAASPAGGGTSPFGGGGGGGPGGGRGFGGRGF